MPYITRARRRVQRPELPGRAATSARWIWRSPRWTKGSESRAALVAAIFDRFLMRAARQRRRQMATIAMVGVERT
jgi:hypothetical protein